MSSPVVYWELMCRDLKKQQMFFSQVFDWDIGQQSGPSWVSVSTGMCEGTITQVSPPASELTLVIQVDDVAATVDKAIRLGARVVYPPGQSADGGVISLIRDPEGNLLWVSRPGAGASA